MAESIIEFVKAKWRQMATSEKDQEVSQLECDFYPDSTSGTWFHTNHVNLGIRIVQITVRHATEDFSGRLIEDRDLVEPLVEGLS